MSGISANNRKVVVPPKWWEILPRKAYSKLEIVETCQPWFEVYRINPEVYVIYEPGQFEEAISTLVLGKEKAALIDTGCGIGNIKALALELTNLPIIVVNTHSHNDHVAQNFMFEDVAIYDHPVSRKAAESGYDHEKMIHLIAEGMVWKPLPVNFDLETYYVPPFKVTKWLKDGDIIDLGGKKIEVLYTPGHSPDSICLLDRDLRLLWTGDIFYTGAIYTYLPGGDVDKFIESYRRLISFSHLYDWLMPSHNEPLVEKEILKEVLKAVENIKAGIDKDFIEGVDSGVKIRRYNYERFSIITRVE